MSHTEARPLIEKLEGEDQDDRASLRAAWKRIQYGRRHRKVTDLHVREFVFHVFARDRDGRGVQMSYAEIAQELECSIKTARSAVERAWMEYGLIDITEQRFVAGGQAANRYSVNWWAVREINTSGICAKPAAPSGTPPVPTGQGPALSGHPPVPTGHPYKESPRTIPRTKPEIHSPPPVDPERSSGESPDPWEVVVSVLLDLGMVRAQEAVTAAKSRELTASQVDELIVHWERLQARQSHVTVAWLYRWLMGLSQPPAAKDGQEKPSHERNRSLTSETTRWNLIEARIVKAGRNAGASEERIRQRVSEAKERFDSIGKVAVFQTV